MTADWPPRQREAWEAAVRHFGGPPFGLRHWDGDRRLHSFGRDGDGAVLDINLTYGDDGRYSDGPVVWVQTAYLGLVSPGHGGSAFTALPPLDERLRGQLRSLLRPDDDDARAAVARAPIEQVRFDVEGTPTTFDSMSAGDLWVTRDPMPYAWAAYAEVAGLAVTISARLVPGSAVALVRANAADYL